MKRIGIALLMVAHFTCVSWAITKNKSIAENNFSHGVDTYHNPQSLPEGFVQDSNNVFFDNQAPVQKRNGYTVAWSTKSYNFTGLWTYTDNTNTTWLIARSSDQITASNLAGSIVKVTTVSINDIVNETNAFGNAYFVDQTQGVYYWNGTATTYVSGSPKGSLITTFHNRLWVSGAAVPNGNQLYGSKYGDGTTWTTGPNPTDPVQYSVGLQDNFDNLTAQYVYLDTLYEFKHSSIYALYGFDQTNFQISQLTQECGCIDGGSIQTYNGSLEFVSLRGVEAFNGYTCKRISDSIKNKVDPAIFVGSFSQQSWIQSSQTDWLAATTMNLNVYSAPPVIQYSSFSFTNSQNSDFNAGTSSNTTVSNNKVTLATNNSGTVNDPGFETFINNDYTVGTFSQSTSVNMNCTVNPHSGSYMAQAGTMVSGTFTMDIQAIDTNNNVLQTTQLTYFGNISPCTGWHQFNLTPSASNTGKRVYFKIVSEDFSSNYIQTKSSYIWGGTLSVYVNLDIDASDVVWLFDDISGGSSTISTGYYTSQTFDTGLASTSYVLMNTNWSAIESTPTFELDSSPDTIAWSKLTSSTGTNISDSNRYLRYVSSFSVLSGDALSSLNSVNIALNASSGTFKSPIHNISSINSWGNFSVQEALNGGGISFSICSSTSSNMGYPASCTSQTPNTPITIATGTYVQWYATFTVTAATQNPTLQSGAVQWFTGSKATPMSSTVWDNRYWLSLTTNTADTSNDAVLVLDTRGAWAPMDIHAGAFTQYKNNLYHADSRATGNIYLDNQGEGDNGSPINAYIRTRAFSFGELAADDYIYALYPSAVNSGNCSMTMSYEMDQTGVLYSLSPVTLSEYNSYSSVRVPFPITSSNQDFGQTFDLLVGTNDSQCDWQFYGLDMLYKQRPIY